MAELPWEVVEDKTWEAVVQYIEKRMNYTRHTGGKFNIRNEELWRLKKAMQEVDPTITNVGVPHFRDHENAEYDVNK